MRRDRGEVEERKMGGDMQVKVRYASNVGMDGWVVKDGKAYRG